MDKKVAKWPGAIQLSMRLGPLPVLHGKDRQQLASRTRSTPSVSRNPCIASRNLCRRTQNEKAMATR